MESYPSRLVLTNQYNNLISVTKIVRSFGVIAYCLATEQWLLVQRKVTPSFFTLISGKYLTGNLPIICCKLTVKERRIILSLIEAAASRDKDKFVEILRPYYSCGRHDDIYDLFITRENILRISLEKEEDILEEPPWYFPRGRSKNKSETELETALREFEEETGISRSLLELFSATPIVENYQGSNGQQYHIKYFIYTLKFEPLPPPISQKDWEIQNRGWFNFSQASKLLKNNQQLTLHKAQSILRTRYGESSSALSRSSRDD